MSYQVVVLPNPIPKTDPEVWKLAADRIRKRSKGDAPFLLRMLTNQITARFPQLKDLPKEQSSKCVWNNGQILSGLDFAVLTIVDARVEDVFPFVVETAHSLGLAVLDEQARKIYRAKARIDVAIDDGSNYSGMAPGAVPPPKGLRVHTGESIPPEMEFFEEPADIGPMISKYSSLYQDDKPRSLKLRLLYASGPMIALLGLGLYFMYNQDVQMPAPFLLAFVIIGALPAWIVFYLTDFWHTCTYVGENGIAEATIHKDRGRISSKQTLRFADAANLYTYHFHKTYKGSYLWSFYDFTWTGRNDARGFRIKGKYHLPSLDGQPGNRIRFAEAAQRAWTNRMVKILQTRLERDGYIEFKVGNHNVRVGPEFIIFSFGKTPQRIEADEIASASMIKGKFYITHVDAEWFNGGRFSFDCRDMANVSVFLLAMQRLCNQSIIPQY